MTAWDAARIAQRRPLPKPIRMHGPVGPADANTFAKQCCPHCGYHVCSSACARRERDQAARELGFVADPPMIREWRDIGTCGAPPKEVVINRYMKAGATVMYRGVLYKSPRDATPKELLACRQEPDERSEGWAAYIASPEGQAAFRALLDSVWREPA